MLVMDTNQPGYGFQDYMIQAKTSIKFLKYLGIGLVALPEPFTTPFGVALLFAANYLSQNTEPSLDNLLPGTPAYHSYWFKHPGDLIDSASSGQRPISGQFGLPETSAYQSYWFKRSGNYAESATGEPAKRHSGQPPVSWLYADSRYLKAEPDPVRQPRRERRDRERLTAPPIGEPISLTARERWH
jgi:hypothetical protein